MAEKGSGLAAELWSMGQPVVASILSYPEGRAALALAKRLGRLSARGHARALADFEEIQVELVTVGVDHELARHAGELAEENALRGYDAVQLASALALGTDPPTLVTWDRDLSAAAARSGCPVAPA